MTPIVRFAPSPTGRLHIGNIRTALLNWLYAHANGGQFLLRLDDTDRARSTVEFAQAIHDDLTWLGLGWDAEFRQSDREAMYAAAADKLKAAGRLYPCYETEDELGRKRKRQLARGMPPTYDRAALKLTDDERSALEREGRVPFWRFKLDNTGGVADGPVVPTPVQWDDLVRGPQQLDASALSDPVLIRGDGSFLYTFTSVVDDIDKAITHVIRGEDHVTNTAVQIQIFQALGGTLPAFGHFSLLVGAEGEALSKRIGSLSVDGLRAANIEPMAVNSLAGLIGTSDAVEPRLTLEALAATFDLSKLSRSPSRFDVAELDALNAKLLHITPFFDVASRLAAMGVDDGEAFWLAVRPNLSKLPDAKIWHDVVSGRIKPVIEDAAFTTEAAQLLPQEPWSDVTWGQWTDTIKAKTGRKGKALFHPLRLALTGADTGPELKVLLPLIGRTQASQRLLGKAA